MLVVGAICFGVGAYAILWGATRTVDNVIMHRGRHSGTARQMAISEERAWDIVETTVNDAFRDGAVTLVIAVIAFTGAYVVFICFVRRKRE